MADETLPQQELPLPFPELSGDLPLLPARMVNEYQYCPRLAYLEWVQGEWAESSDTVEGRYVHRRVDKPGGDLPAATEESDERFHARSITLSSNRLGLIARMDLIEAEGSRVTPVDYKRGKRPHVQRGAYDPERVQLCVQGLILEEHGYVCDEGVLYFAESRERVRVMFDEELRALTRNAIDGLRLIAARRDRRIPQLHDTLIMKEEHLYVVTYDIGDQKRWRRIFNVMNGYGEWLQLSVFQCRLSRQWHAELIALLDGMIHHDEDHVLLIDVGPADHVVPRVVSLGESFEPVVREPVIV